MAEQQQPKPSTVLWSDVCRAVDHVPEREVGYVFSNGVEKIPEKKPA